MPNIAPQLHEVGIAETRAIAVDFQGKLEQNSPLEKLSGTPTVTEVTTTDLTLASKAISTGILSINGVDVPIAMAVQFTVDASGGTVGKEYTIKIVCGTDGSQTVSGYVKVKVL